jgi:hypothetical protein
MLMFAYEINIGDVVKLSDGTYDEVINIQPANLGKSVAITVEEEDIPIVVHREFKIWTRD